MTTRFMLYSHDGLGLGHVRRNLALASALADAADGVSVLLATGVPEVDELGSSQRGTDVLRLPGLRKVANERYTPRRLQISSADLRVLRANLLVAAVEAFAPDVLVVDKHPLGVRGELRPALRALREAGGRAVLGWRDILDEGRVVRAEWAASGVLEAVTEHYDRILVYGQREVFDAAAEYELPPTLAARLTYCGYVAEPPPEGTPSPLPPPDGRPRVLATVGGGEDGFSFLQTFLHATARADWDTVVVAGPHAPAWEMGDLRRLAKQTGARFYPFLRNLAAEFPSVDALVCMGGYNTLAEAMATGTPTVVVPRVMPRSEQLLRSLAFARMGLLSMVLPTALSLRTLRGAIDTALARSRDGLAERIAGQLRLDGATRAAVVLLELAGTAPGSGHLHEAVPECELL